MVPIRIRDALLTAALLAGLCVPALADAGQPPLPGTTGAQAATPVDGRPFKPKDIPCTCRFKGEDFGVGDQVCIRGRMAQCAMYLNNTSWKMLDTPCPVAAIGDRAAQ